MSTVKVSNIQKTGETVSRDVSGVAAAFAWYDGFTSNAVPISFGGSSGTDNSLGSYTVNLTNAAATVYQPTSVTSCRSSAPSASGNAGGTLTNVNAAIIILKTEAGNGSDSECSITVHGDLA